MSITASDVLRGIGRGIEAGAALAPVPADARPWVPAVVVLLDTAAALLEGTTATQRERAAMDGAERFAAAVEAAKFANETNKET